MVRHGGFICQRISSYFDVLLPFWFLPLNFGSILVPKRAQAGPKPGPSRAQAGPKPGPSWAQARPRPGPSRPQAGPKLGPSRAQAGPKPGPRGGHFQNPIFLREFENWDPDIFPKSQTFKVSFSSHSENAHIKLNGFQS